MKIPVHKTLVLTTHAVEYSIAIPANTATLSFQIREADTSIIYYFKSTAGQPTGGNYFTLPGGSSKLIAPITSGMTLYVQAQSNDGRTLEVEYITEQ